MTFELTDFQRVLCNRLQNPLPICCQPFDQLACELDCPEEQILKNIKQLKTDGIIKRFGPVINHSVLGKSSLLCTGHVPKNQIEQVAQIVNQLKQVSHNYLRNHYYNLWFTLQSSSRSRLFELLDRLEQHTSLTFHGLGAIRRFKLDTRFDAFARGLPATASDSRSFLLPTSELTEREQAFLDDLPNDFEINPQPFKYISGNFSKEESIKILKSLEQKGILKRISAIVDYQKLGYTANALFIFRCPTNRIFTVGQALARSSLVSHCYQREVFDGWDYNMFAMTHATSEQRLRRVTEDIACTNNISEYDWLETLKEFKKQPVSPGLVK